MGWVTTSLSAVFSLSLVSIAGAQGVPAAVSQDNLSQQVNDHLRRIAALEAQLVELQRQIKELRDSSLRRPVEPPPAPVEQEEPPFEHAVAGEPPREPDPEGP